MPTLVLSPRYSDDSINLRRAAVALGWDMMRLAGWRCPDDFEPEEPVLFAGALFNAAVAEQLGLAVIEPPEDFLIRLPAEYVILEAVQGDMADLSVFPDARFDLIFHPVSNVFVPDVRPVWREAFRVLRPGGSLLAGFMNPVQYLFDDIALERGELRVAHRIPYSDLDSPTEEEGARLAGEGRPLESGHTLADQIGGQLAAGLLLAGFYEDIDTESVLGEHIPSYIATRALRPRS